MKSKFLKKTMLKKSLAWMLALTIALGETGYASAQNLTGDVTAGDVTDVTNGDVTDGDTTDGDTTDGDVTDGDVTDGDVTDGNVSDGDVTGNELQMFPGLAEEYTLTSADLEDKSVLEDYSKEWREGKEGEDYVPNEIMVSAESREDALAYAEAFNGTLQDYFLGVAVITLNADEKFPEATVYDAVSASAQVDSKLPAAWPNYYCYADDTSVEEVAVGEVQMEEPKTDPTEFLPDAYSDPFLNYPNASYQWHHSAINSRVAWNAGYKGEGTKVFVLDTGIKSGHEDVTAVDTYDVGYGTEDGNGHGTHVCGIIGAKQNNGKGGCGVAPECSVYSIKVLQDNGSGATSIIIKGVNKAIEMGANIVNMSLGSSYYNAAAEKAYENAYAAGIAVFCAAGNEFSNSPHYPAAYKKTISVAALESSMSKAYFSNYDSGVRYAAPGVGIYSTYYKGSSSYTSMAGTSQATPVTAGAAAVIWPTLQGSGTARVDALLKKMDESCTKVNGKGLGKGCVNLAKALNLSDEQSAPAKPVFSSKAGTYYGDSIKVTISSPEPGCTLYYSLDGKPVTYKNGTVSSNARKYSGAISVTGAVTINAIAVKNSNKQASQTATARYVIKSPVQSIEIRPDAITLIQGTSLTLTAVCTPSYAANKKVSWSVEADKESGVTISTSGKVTASKNAKPGSYVVTAKALGAATGREVTATMKVIVVEAVSNPVTAITAKTKSITIYKGQIGGLENIVVKKKDKTTGSISDLVWSVADESIASVSVLSNDGELQIKGLKAGNTTVTGTARDGSGKSIVLKVAVVQPVTKIRSSNNITTYQLAQGKSLKLGVSIAPSNAYNKKVEWSVSPADKGVTVNNGTVKAAKNATGSYIISAKAADGSNVSEIFSIQIKQDAAKKLAVGSKSVDLFRVTNTEGAATSAYVSVTCDQEDWIVASSAPSLVSVDKSGDNMVQVQATGNGTGTATVTVSTTDGSNKKASFKVTVKNPASSLMLAPTGGKTIYVAKGTSMQLSATFGTGYGKLNADAKKLQWSSDNPKVVKVDNKGKVTALVNDMQEVMITARTTDGSNLVATYVVASCEKVTKMKIGNGEPYTMKQGEERLLWLWQNDSFYNDCSYVVDVKSNKEGLTAGLSKDSYGVPSISLVGNKKGTYTVTVSCLDGSSAKASIKVVVK